MRAFFNPLTPSTWDSFDRIASELRNAARVARTERVMGGRPDNSAEFHYDLISRAAYPEGFSEVVDRLQAGDQEAIAPMVAWLAADPFCRFSGYEKHRVMRYLARSKLSTKQAATIRSLLLRVVERGGRPEFRMACRLARHVENAPFRQDLLRLAASTDAGTARRATWMLTACERNDDPR